MDLSHFIRTQMEEILTIWERQAKETLPAHMTSPKEIRDHVGKILQGVAACLERAQSGCDIPVANPNHPQSLAFANVHGEERYEQGVEITHLANEFQVLRMTVIELWSRTLESDAVNVKEIIAFNYELDQVLAQSVERYDQEKQKQGRLFETMLSSLPDPCYILSLGGNFRYANKAMAELCGLPADEIIGKSFTDMPLPAHYNGREQLAKILRDKQQQWGEIDVESSAGDLRSFETILAPVIDTQGQTEAISGIAHDITFRKKSEAEIWRHANYDSVTEVPNRRLFRDRLEQHAAHSDRTGDPFALLFIDLDKFKDINDKLGHDAGDKLLRYAAERIEACIRHSDTVARIGGDEFTVLLLDTGDRELIKGVAEKIITELKRPFTLEQEEVLISGSVGVTLFPEDAGSDQQLLNNADEAMYRAKQAGRNQVCFFDHLMLQSRSVRQELIEQLKDAKNNGQLRLYFQPIIDLSNGQIAKAEALVRWQHPEKGVMLPEEFLGLAEQTGLMASLEDWVFTEAAAQLENWNAEGLGPIELTINASSMQFIHDDKTKPWAPHLEQFSRIGTNVVIEVTEDIFLQNTDYLAKRLSELKAAGVKLALDDFGSGRSSLSYLSRFDVNYLKIDQTFLRDSGAGSCNRVIAETIVSMAHKLGLMVVAEGVETSEQRDWLKDIKCDFAQGFLFSKPQSADDFEQSLKAERLACEALIIN